MLDLLLRVMLQGCTNDSTKFNGPRIIETAQDKLLELKARKLNENVIPERPQDIKYERPQPMSKLRKCQIRGWTVKGVGQGKLRGENWMYH